MLWVSIIYYIEVGCKGGLHYTDMLACYIICYTVKVLWVRRCSHICCLGPRGFQPAVFQMLARCLDPRF